MSRRPPGSVIARSSRVRPHTRVVANLVQTSSGDYEIPQFNPLRLLAGDTVERAEEQTPDSEGEVTVVMRDFGAVPPQQRTMLTLTTEDILGQVREVAMPAGLALPVALPADGGFAARPRVRNDVIDPDDPNVMRVVKRTPEATASAVPPDRTAIASQETPSPRSCSSWAVRDDVRLIAAAFTRGGREITLRDGQRIRVLFAQGRVASSRCVSFLLGSAARRRRPWPRPTRAAMSRSRIRPRPSPSPTIPRTTRRAGACASTPPSTRRRCARRSPAPSSTNSSASSATTSISRGVSAPTTCSRCSMPRTTRARPAAATFYAALTTGGETRRYYRFHSTADGVIDFYDERASRRASSSSASPSPAARCAPASACAATPSWAISRCTPASTGRTASAPPSSPPATASSARRAGRAATAGIEIEHPNGYTSTYSHLSGFARGITEGARVRQGQVIGCLGDFGLSTGPHLHYEVMVNGRFVDPMRVRVPRGRELTGPMLTAFRTERERIDALMTRDRADAGHRRTAPSR